MIKYLIEQSSIKTYDENKLAYYLEHIDSHLSQLLSLIEDDINNNKWDKEKEELLQKHLSSVKNNAITIGFSGVGGAGKSSLIDEIIRNFTVDFPDKRLAILAIDPTKKGKGCAFRRSYTFKLTTCKQCLYEIYGYQIFFKCHYKSF